MVNELFSDFKINNIVGKLRARNFMKISKVEKTRHDLVARNEEAFRAMF